MHYTFPPRAEDAAGQARCFFGGGLEVTAAL